ncbi:alpha/beta hydrolase [Spirosoma aureum]|uniref:Alpha/beta hydrolase n=1 Tax=Spirosoma aureum TaxID=2692134 RepID=A0A6G9ARJ0_9BACT|nr:alpha/beta hydrolase-fold protein [Spirosoma aureum]QIP14833.1 alpha/beta hydrolase [Spirosoma aureum]
MKIVVSVALFFCTILSFGQSNKVKKIDQTQLFILGVIDQIVSTELSETRTLNIYLPEGYTKNDTAKYPVVYLLDGSADEDFIHIIGLYQFNNFAWINRVPKSIIVGIANIDRRRDFTFPTTNAEDLKKYPTSGHSDKFFNFIEKELQPYIQAKYRTNSSKTIIGQSLGGLLATEILLKKPLLFNKYIIVSPSLWWDNGSLLANKSALLQKDFPEKTDIYIGVGKEGLTPGTIPRVMEVDANLLADKLRSSESSQVTVHFDYLPQEDHATVTHQAVFNALRLLYPVIHSVK